MEKCNQVHSNFMEIQREHLIDQLIASHIFTLILQESMNEMSLEQMHKENEVHKKKMMLLKFIQFERSINYIMKTFKL
jgi:hypothetical protein